MENLKKNNKKLLTKKGNAYNIIIRQGKTQTDLLYDVGAFFIVVRLLLFLQ